MSFLVPWNSCLLHPNIHNSNPLFSILRIYKINLPPMDGKRSRVKVNNFDRLFIKAFNHQLFWIDFYGDFYSFGSDLEEVSRKDTWRWDICHIYFTNNITQFNCDSWIYIIELILIPVSLFCWAIFLFGQFNYEILLHPFHHLQNHLFYRPLTPIIKTHFLRFLCLIGRIGSTFSSI
jgi:hypothetical protein